MAEHEMNPETAVANDITREVAHLRWLRDCVNEFHAKGNPTLADLSMDVATIATLTPVLTAALVRVSKALSGKPAPRPGRNRNRK